MQNLEIEQTTHTPLIELDAKEGIIKFSGKSYPENTFSFYAPVLEWIDQYIEDTEYKKLDLIMDVDYLNSSSTKIYYDIFDKLDNAMGKTISIKWIYDEDDDMTFETGEEFQEDYEDLDFKFVVK